MTDCVVRFRVDEHIKTKATKLFRHMGLTISEAMRLFLYQSRHGVYVEAFFGQH